MSYIYELRQVANKIDDIKLAEAERVAVRDRYNSDFTPEADAAVAASRAKVDAARDEMVRLVMEKPDVFQRALRSVANEREAKLGDLM